MEIIKKILTRIFLVIIIFLLFVVNTGKGYTPPVERTGQGQEIVLENYPDAVASEKILVRGDNIEER